MVTLKRWKVQLDGCCLKDIIRSANQDYAYTLLKKKKKRIKENKGKRELTLTKLADNSIQSKEKSDS